MCVSVYVWVYICVRSCVYAHTSVDRQILHFSLKSLKQVGVLSIIVKSKWNKIKDPFNAVYVLSKKFYEPYNYTPIDSHWVIWPLSCQLPLVSLDLITGTQLKQGPPCPCRVHLQFLQLRNRTHDLVIMAWTVAWMVAYMVSSLHNQILPFARQSCKSMSWWDVCDVHT